MRRKLPAILITLVVTGFALSARTHQGLLLNSAETIDPGNFKLGIAPVMIFGKGGADPVWGVAGKAGLGLMRRVDVEVTGAYFKDLVYFGADLEVWLIKGPNVNASGAVGWHLTNVKTGTDSSGIDLTFLVSTRPVNKLEITAGIKAAFDTFKNTNQTVTLVHLVPGFEYKINSDLDALLEIGLGLNNDSWHYLAFGLAYYFL